MPRRRTPVIAALSAFTAAIALSACGSSGGAATAATTGGETPSSSSSTSSGNSGSATAASACDLLTVSEIDAATKASFNAGKLEKNQDTPYGKYTSCVWQDKAHPLNAVRVSTWASASGFEAAKQTAGDIEEVSGIGEKAFSASFASVYVLANGHAMFAQYYSPDGSDEEHLPISESLAKAAAARL